MYIHVGYATFIIYTLHEEFTFLQFYNLASEATSNKNMQIYINIKIYLTNSLAKIVDYTCFFLLISLGDDYIYFIDIHT